MKAYLPIELTREVMVSALAQYARQSCPSAMLNLLADALNTAADACTDARDATWTRTVATALRADSEAARADEDAIYLEGAPVMAGARALAEGDVEPSPHIDREPTARALYSLATTEVGLLVRACSERAKQLTAEGDATKAHAVRTIGMGFISGYYEQRARREQGKPWP